MCRADAVAILLDFGMQPICNRFLASPMEEQYLHPITIGQCAACGLVQIIDPAPAHELVPPYDWITYKEPEDHLDRLAETIMGLPGVSSKSSVAGISFKDDSTLARLEGLGIEHTWRVDPEGDLNVSHQGGGVETVQDRFTSQTALEMADRYGRPDVVVARHILEHAYDAPGFLEALKQLIRPGGFVVMEAPDCARSLDGPDYSAIWEEHTLYFTEATFNSSLGLAGFDTVKFEQVAYPLEDSLVAILSPVQREHPAPPGHDTVGEVGRARAYAAQFDSYKATFRRLLEQTRQDGGRVAMFGAGHLACTTINLLELGDLIDFVVDDDPNKQGLFMAGSALPIRAREALVADGVSLCLLGLNLDIEARVIGNNSAFTAAGGEFMSIFTASRFAAMAEFSAAGMDC